MRTTKENQFGRVKTINLVELLQVTCDDSAIYVTKLIDIGNGRDTALKEAKSKYLEKKFKHNRGSNSGYRRRNLYC